MLTARDRVHKTKLSVTSCVALIDSRRRASPTAIYACTHDASGPGAMIRTLRPTNYSWTFGSGPGLERRKYEPVCGGGASLLSRLSRGLAFQVLG